MTLSCACYSFFTPIFFMKAMLSLDFLVVFSTYVCLRVTGNNELSAPLFFPLFSIFFFHSAGVNGRGEREDEKAKS